MYKQRLKKRKLSKGGGAAGHAAGEDGTKVRVEVSLPW